MVPLRSWVQSLNSQEKLLISDAEFMEECEWRSEFSPSDWEEPIIGSAWTIVKIREAKKNDFFDAELVDLLLELKRIRNEHLWSGEKMKNIEIKLILEKHGIFVDEIISNLEGKFQQRKNKIFENLSEWTVSDNSGIIKIDGSFHMIGHLLNKEEYGSLKNAIVQYKIEDMKKNPQNWKIFESAKFFQFPWSGPMTYVERKDGKEHFDKSSFNQQQWKEAEKALGEKQKFFFSIIAVSVVILIFLVVFLFLSTSHLNINERLQNLPIPFSR